MKTELSPDRTRLTITATDQERETLRNLEDVQSDNALHAFFETLICNSAFDWFTASQTGDLTDAPILGVMSAPEFKRHNHAILDNPKNIICSCNLYGLMVARVFERWAFMDYQVRSVLEDLRDKGEAVFVGGIIYTPQEIKTRLEYLRGELRAERASLGEIYELQTLSAHIPADDVELREAAGMEEN